MGNFNKQTMTEKIADTVTNGLIKRVDLMEKSLSGITFRRGVHGPTGEAGSKGVQGDQGLQGYNGEQGIQGDKGDRGNQGEKGKDVNPKLLEAILEKLTAMENKKSWIRRVFSKS